MRLFPGCQRKGTFSPNSVPFIMVFFGTLVGSTHVLHRLTTIGSATQRRSPPSRTGAQGSALIHLASDACFVTCNVPSMLGMARSTTPLEPLSDFRTEQCSHSSSRRNPSLAALLRHLNGTTPASPVPVPSLGLGPQSNGNCSPGPSFSGTSTGRLLSATDAVGAPLAAQQLCHRAAYPLPNYSFISTTMSGTSAPPCSAEVEPEL